MIVIVCSYGWWYCRGRRGSVDHAPLPVWRFCSRLATSRIGCSFLLVPLWALCSCMHAVTGGAAMIQEAKSSLHTPAGRLIRAGWAVLGFWVACAVIAVGARVLVKSMVSRVAIAVSRRAIASRETIAEGTWTCVVVAEMRWPRV